MIDIEWQQPTPSDAARTDLHRITARATHGLASVRATWFVGPNSPAVAPHEVTVTRVRRAGQVDAVERGVTSPVLADAQVIVVEMTRRLPERAKDLAGVDPMKEIRRHARRLPAGPRGDAAYYTRLLDVFDMIERTGVRNPVKVLVELTGKPESTINLHLRKARALRDESQV